MSGVAPATGLPREYPPADDSIWKMGQARVWKRVSEPISDETRASAPFPGVGLPGLFALYRQRQVGGRVGVVVSSKIGVASDQWAPSHPAGLYLQTVSRARAAVTLWGPPRGILLADGANDAAGGLTVWLTNWLAFRTNLGNDVPAAAGLPMVHYQLPPTTPHTVTQARWDAVRDLQAAMSDSTMVTGVDAWPWIDDKFHLTAPGLVLMAQAFVAGATRL